MKRVNKVELVGEYRLQLTSDDGVSGVVDLSGLIGKGVFSLWRDPGARARSHRDLWRTRLERSG